MLNIMHKHKYVKYKAKYLALGGVDEIDPKQVQEDAEKTKQELVEVFGEDSDSDSAVSSGEKTVVQPLVESSPLAVTCTCNL